MDTREKRRVLHTHTLYDTDKKGSEENNNNKESTKW